MALVAIAALVAALGASVASATDPVAAPPSSTPRAFQTEMGGDRFMAGSTLRVETPVKGDAIAAGGRIELSAPVGGDAVLLGGQVILRSAVAGDVYAGGGRVQISGEIGRNVRAAGAQVELASTARLAGNASLAGGEVNLRAPVKGSVQIAGSQVLIDSAVDGDVNVTAQQIELGPSARVGGALRWRSPNELERRPGAQVAGPIERLEMPAARDIENARERGHEAAGRNGRAAGWLALGVWTLGLMLVAAVGVAALPQASARVVKDLLLRGPWSLLVGFVTLVCVPVAVVILLVSLVGAPLGLLGLLTYLVLLPLGYVVGAAALGQWGLARWKAEAVDRVGWRIGAAAIALLLLALIGRIPFLGGFLLFLLMLGGLGAIVRQFLPRQEVTRDETQH